MDEPIVSIDDFERIARSKLPPEVFDYYAGGAGREWTLRANLAAFDKWILRPRVLVGVADRDASTEVLGSRVSFPVLVAPWAFQSRADPDGEVATARAAARAGTIMVLSATASHRLDDVAKASNAPKWFQLYMYGDRGFSKEALLRAYELGFGAVVFTVDVPVLGKRDRDRRNELEMPIEGPGQELDFDPSITWDDLAWLRQAYDEPEENGLTPLRDTAAVAAWEPDQACAAGLVLADAGGEDGDEDEIVDAEHDLERGERDKRGPRMRIRKQR